LHAFNGGRFCKVRRTATEPGPASRYSLTRSGALSERHCFEARLEYRICEPTHRGVKPSTAT
jgi:hypothetical protein